MQMSIIWRGHPKKYKKGNHCRIAIKAFIDYGDIRNTYITPAIAEALIYKDTFSNFNGAPGRSFLFQFFRRIL